MAVDNAMSIESFDIAPYPWISLCHNPIKRLLKNEWPIQHVSSIQRVSARCLHLGACDFRYSIVIGRGRLATNEVCSHPGLKHSGD